MSASWEQGAVGKRDDTFGGLLKMNSSLDGSHSDDGDEPISTSKLVFMEGQKDFRVVERKRI